MYCCYENEFRLHSRLPCNIWTFRVQNTTELICNGFLVLVKVIHPKYYKHLKKTLIEIVWSDLIFKQQSSWIYRSAGTPVLLLSTLVYS